MIGRRTGHHPGSCRPSRVSHRLHSTGHVAIGLHEAVSRNTAAVCPPFRVGIVSESIRHECDSISEGRSKKHPLTPRQRAFAVRHRLLLNSPASDYSPFVVQLFVAAGFASGPRFRSQNRFRRSPARKLPTPATLNAPENRRGPRGRDLPPLGDSPALRDDGLD